MYWRPFAMAFLALLAVTSRLESQGTAAVEVPVFNIQPGRTTRAEADLRLGEPLRKLAADAQVQSYEYAPPREAPEADRVVISYFTDTWQTARIDVHLKVPIAADALREQFGTPVIVRERTGQREELYYPRLQGLLLAGNAPDGPVAVVSYLSRRWLADYYIDRFDESMRGGKDDEARFAADKAVIVAPEYARGYIAQGIFFSKRNDQAEARVRFQAGGNAAAGPRARALARLWLGHWYSEQGKQPREAEAEYRKAVEEVPALAEAHLRYGLFLIGQKRPGEAIVELNKAVALEPANMEAHRNLADVLRNQRRYREEYSHLETLLAWVNAGGATDPVLRGKILRRYAEALWPGRSEPERPPFGKPQQALDAYRKAAQADPHDHWAFLSMGNIYRELGEPVRAVECYRSGLQRAPQSFELQRALGIALLESGSYTEALRVAEASVPIDPKFACAQMVQVARAWGALRDKKRTLEWLHKAAEAGYNDRQYLSTDRFFNSLHGNGDFKRIVERMQ